ncbi:hypothetical protein MRX96_019502 [Rhipicephalus microplus]
MQGTAARQCQGWPSLQCTRLSNRGRITPQEHDLAGLPYTPRYANDMGEPARSGTRRFRRLFPRDRSARRFWPYRSSSDRAAFDAAGSNRHAGTTRPRALLDPAGSRGPQRNPRASARADLAAHKACAAQIHAGAHLCRQPAQQSSVRGRPPGRFGCARLNDFRPPSGQQPRRRRSPGDSRRARTTSPTDARTHLWTNEEARKVTRKSAMRRCRLFWESSGRARRHPVGR